MPSLLCELSRYAHCAVSPERVKAGVLHGESVISIIQSYAIG